MKYLVAVFLSMMTSLAALMVGNPAEPQIIDQGFWIAQDAFMGIKVGYGGDFIADRKMHATSRARGRIDQTKLFLNQGIITLNFLDRLEIYGSIGSMNGELSNRPHRDNKRRQYQTHDGLTAGCGGRFLLAQWGKTVIGVDGKIQWGNPGMKWMAVDGVSANTGGHLRYCEWQVSAAVSYTVDWLTPYLGVKYSNVHSTVSGIPNVIYPRSHFKMMNRDRFGFVLGATLSPSKKFDVFAEVQMVDEQAFSLGGNMKF